MKIYKILLIIAGVIGAILWFLLPSGDVPVDVAATNSNVNLMFIVSYVLFGIAIVLTVLFSIKSLLSHHKIKEMLISLVVFALILVVSYALATGSEVKTADGSVLATANTSRLVGGGLIAFYILAAVAVISLVFSSIKKILIR
ncbi:hypothetical protein [Sinomicrobium weinanense]|uniref:Uncharacterized protein n=1 Tax=Sinomicrobium weinanense TaxID=2842200 RepID=A0A926Q244_9FLAO|nr:hypothetical protein [Sinomicrobium weinanense]MBC9794531.1 hypothetical protein [Sinomicrobium weinanense]MBU3124438.1 hypothetical protein [Sinomicrobium weinanense]